MQFLKIVSTCVVAAILYGILHDLFTAHICVEYFSIYHPPIFETKSPTLLAIGWGIVATWWMGTFLGILLALASRVGSWKKIEVSELIRPIFKLLLVMGLAAVAAGCAGFALTHSGVIDPPESIAVELPIYKHARFMADWWAHNASYLVGFFGGIVLCVITVRKRRQATLAGAAGQ